MAQESSGAEGAAQLTPRTFADIVKGKGTTWQPATAAAAQLGSGGDGSGQFYFELIVLHVDDMCSMNHVCIKHIITDDKDNFNRY